MVFRILIHESEYMINQGAALIVEPTLQSRLLIPWQGTQKMQRGVPSDSWNENDRRHRIPAQ